jgi:hypothetical protein
MEACKATWGEIMSLDQIYNLVRALHSIHDFLDIDWKTQFTLFICMDSKTCEFKEKGSTDQC